MKLDLALSSHPTRRGFPSPTLGPAPFGLLFPPAHAVCVLVRLIGRPLPRARGLTDLRWPQACFPPPPYGYHFLPHPPTPPDARVPLAGLAPHSRITRTPRRAFISPSPPPAYRSPLCSSTPVRGPASLHPYCTQPQEPRPPPPPPNPHQPPLDPRPKGFGKSGDSCLGRIPTPCH